MFTKESQLLLAIASTILVLSASSKRVFTQSTYTDNACSGNPVAIVGVTGPTAALGCAFSALAANGSSEACMPIGGDGGATKKFCKESETLDSAPAGKEGSYAMIGYYESSTCETLKEVSKILYEILQCAPSASGSTVVNCQENTVCFNYPHGTSE